MIIFHTRFQFNSQRYIRTQERNRVKMPRHLLNIYSVNLDCSYLIVALHQKHERLSAWLTGFAKSKKAKRAGRKAAFPT